jgi:hypothetical protein
MMLQAQGETFYLDIDRDASNNYNANVSAMNSKFIFVVDSL